MLGLAVRIWHDPKLRAALMLGLLGLIFFDMDMNTTFCDKVV
jgi:hypothetical protein